MPSKIANSISIFQLGKSKKFVNNRFGMRNIAVRIKNQYNIWRTFGKVFQNLEYYILLPRHSIFKNLPKT